MALNGLAAGLSMADMRHMKYTHLMHMLYEYDDMHEDAGEGGSKEQDEIVDATTADLRWMMHL